LVDIARRSSATGATITLHRVARVCQQQLGFLVVSACIAFLCYLCIMCSFSTLILLVGSFDLYNRLPDNLHCVCVGGDDKPCSIKPPSMLLCQNTLSTGYFSNKIFHPGKLHLASTVQPNIGQFCTAALCETDGHTNHRTAIDRDEILVYTLCSEKNTHSHFLSYLHERCVYLNKNCSEGTVDYGNVKIGYSLRPMTSL